LASFSHKGWVHILSALMLPVEGRAQAFGVAPALFFWVLLRQVAASLRLARSKFFNPPG